MKWQPKSIWHAIVPPFAAAFFVIQIIPVYENDIFLHTLLGGHIARGGSTSGDASWAFGPHLDVWHNTMAASELVFYWLYSFLGWGGITLWAAIPAAAFVLLFWQVALRIASEAKLEANSRTYRIAGISTVIATLMFQSFFQTRPQSVIFAVLPIVGWQLLKIAKTGALPKWWHAALFTWVLTCVHPTAILFAPLTLGAVVIHAWLNRKDSKRLKLLAANAVETIGAMVLATLLTPASYLLYESALNIKNSASNVTTEWLGITSAVDPQVLVLLALAAIWVLAITRTNRTQKQPLSSRAYLAEGLLIAGLALGFGSVRRTAAIAAVLISVVVFNRWLLALSINPDTARVRNSKASALDTARPKVWLTTSIGVIGIALLSYGLFVQLPSVQLDAKRQPLTLVRQLAQSNPNAKVYVDYDVSSFVLYALRSGDHNITPASDTNSTAAVSFDGRLDYYGAQVLEDFVRLNDGAEVATLWAPYSESTDVLVDSRSALVPFLREHGWATKATQPGLRPLGDALTWIWLQAPKSSN